MVLGDCQANFCLHLKSAIFIVENNIWRLEGVLKGQQYLSVIKAFMEICPFGSLDGKVPSVYVIFQGLSLEVG